MSLGCEQDISGSQQLVRSTAEICAKRCTAEGAAAPMGTMGPLYRLIQQGYAQILRALLFAAPTSFIPLEPALLRAALTPPSPLPATPWDPLEGRLGNPSGVARGAGHSEVPQQALRPAEGSRQSGQAPASGGSGERAVPSGTEALPNQIGAQRIAPLDSTDRMAHQMVDAVQQRAASLASSVQARVLHFKEASVMQVRPPRLHMPTCLYIFPTDGNPPLWNSVNREVIDCSSSEGWLRLLWCKSVYRSFIGG